MNATDLIITISYFSIPVLLICSLWRYPRLASMPISMLVLLVLFALFILLCGFGHLYRCLEMTNTTAFHYINGATAVVSLMTAIYLMPLVPSILGQLDETIDKLVKLNEETEESRRQLFTFMAFLCHEIRNPLFAITSSTTTLEDTDMTEEQIVAVDSITDSSVLMLRLVNDVLDLSKIDSGKLQLEEKVFDLHRMLDSLAHTIENQVQVRHKDQVQFVKFVDPSVPHQVTGDPVRILQIIYNLLSNSLKFTEKGAIQLKVSVGLFNDAAEIIEPPPASETSRLSRATSSHDDDGDVASSEDMFSMSLLDSVEEGVSTISAPEVVIRIVVTDTGIGVEPSRLATIFKPYSQAKLSDYRKHGGTGLGLSIISGLTKAMGGKISATSTLGQGTSFTVLLPVKLSSGILVSSDDEVDLSTKALVQNVSRVKIPCVGTGSSLLGIGSLDASDRLSTMNGKNTYGSVTDSPSTPAAPTATNKSKMTTNKKPKLEPLVLAPNDHVVLIVDDNVVNQKILAKMLTHFHVEHRIAGNGQEAVNFITTQSRNMNPSRLDLPNISLIFMDLSMPVMDGYEATAVLREKGFTQPIIALTANALQQERDRAAAVGVTDFQTKPILRPDLHKVCQRFLLAMGDC